MPAWINNPYIYMALAALVLKLVIARSLGKQWRPGLDLFLVFLVLSTVQTIFEILSYFLVESSSAWLVNAVINSYYLMLIASAILLPFSVAAIIDQQINQYLVIVAITLMGLMTVMLLGTDLIVRGYRVVGFFHTRIPGDYYWTFQVLILTTFLYNAINLFSHYRKSSREITKVKCANMLFGFIWVLFLVFGIVFAMAYELPVNGAGIFPLAMSIYLLFMSINIRNDKVFDIRAKLPWTAQYKAIQEVIRPYVYKSMEPIDAKELQEKYTGGLLKIANSIFPRAEEQAEWLGVSVTTLNRRKKRNGQNLEKSRYKNW